jgi:hypothetical protein
VTKFHRGQRVVRTVEPFLRGTIIREKGDWSADRWAVLWDGYAHTLGEHAVLLEPLNPLDRIEEALRDSVKEGTTLEEPDSGSK